MEVEKDDLKDWTIRENNNYGGRKLEKKMTRSG